MAWQKGKSGNPGGRGTEKIFADAMRLVVNETDPSTGQKKLRGILEKLVECALAGEGWAIQQVADRLDGKPAQESTLTLHDKREPTDWTREDLVALLSNARNGGGGTVAPDGRDEQSGQLH